MANPIVSIPKGTRDFSPEEMVRRNYIFDTIKGIFKKYGYQPIETPAMENLSTLLGKYGDEGDKLLFRVLNSGDYAYKVPQGEWEKAKNRNEFITSQQLSPFIAEKGLRYDLTVPFARFVVQNQGEIQFPFKRYQIQPVWRADRPQKGRYREFYQCDADVIGSPSLLNEVELVTMIDEVFTKLGIQVTIKLNNRKILAGIAETLGLPDKLVDITTAIDKIDKIGIDKVFDELENKGIDRIKSTKLLPILIASGENDNKIRTIESFFIDNNFQAAIGFQGIGELLEILEKLKILNIKSKIEIDLSLARGLNYYTGAIIEVKANDVQMGSISGGGRYDDLTGIFGLPGVSGVGISFGADRIYDVLEQLNGFPPSMESTIKIMFVNFGEKEAVYCLPILKGLRDKGISAILYPDTAKMKKQMAYADTLKVPFVALAGENEMLSNQITVKNMVTGEQKSMVTDELYTLLNKN